MEVEDTRGKQMENWREKSLGRLPPTGEDKHQPVLPFYTADPHTHSVCVCVDKSPIQITRGGGGGF